VTRRIVCGTYLYGGRSADPKRSRPLARRLQLHDHFILFFQRRRPRVPPGWRQQCQFVGNSLQRIYPDGSTLIMGRIFAANIRASPCNSFRSRCSRSLRARWVRLHRRKCLGSRTCLVRCLSKGRRPKSAATAALQSRPADRHPPILAWPTALAMFDRARCRRRSMLSLLRLIGYP